MEMTATKVLPKAWKNNWTNWIEHWNCPVSVFSQLVKHLCPCPSHFSSSERMFSFGSISIHPPESKLLPHMICMRMKINEVVVTCCHLLKPHKTILHWCAEPLGSEYCWRIERSSGVTFSQTPAFFAFCVRSNDTELLHCKILQVIT